ncbi:hypothetical protein ZWY2020_021776 [Hordeum vulgare]|nr:hypothetical protein ZWY2020_021776 [Hordeum vulgare]
MMMRSPMDPSAQGIIPTIVSIIKKLTGEPLAKCGQIGLKPFCKINPAPKKGDKFWSKRPKKVALKQARPPPKKKSKSKGKVAVTEPSDADESQVGDVFSENEGNESQEDSVEVISVSSDSSSPPPKPARRICGKESLAQAESAFGDLKKSLADQQDARAKSEEKYQVILSEMVKLKAAHNKAQVDQDVAVKQVEKAEAKLEVVQQELAGLKQHISNMAQAIFGPRAANLQNDCVLMLKAIYTLIEQLYTGSVLTVKAVMGAKEPITSIEKVLGCLSTLPPQIGQMGSKADLSERKPPSDL